MNRKIITTVVFVLTIATLSMAIMQSSDVGDAAEPNEDGIIWPTAEMLQYGQSLSESALSGGSPDGLFEWVDGSIIPEANGVGGAPYDVRFTSSDGASTIGSVNVVVTARAIDDHYFTIEISDSSLIFDGTPKIPDVRITFNDIVLKEGSDYYLQCKRNVAPTEQAVLEIHGIGNFNGFVTHSFIIAMGVQESPPVPNVLSIGGGYVTLEPFTGTDYVGTLGYGYRDPQTGEYSWFSDNEIPVVDGQQYTFYLRFTGDRYYNEAIGEGLTVYSAPSYGVGYEVDYPGGCVRPVEGYEISLDANDSWISGGQLDIGPGQDVYVRVAGGDESAVKGVTSNRLNDPVVIDEPVISYQDEKIIFPESRAVIVGSSGAPVHVSSEMSLDADCFGWDGTSDVVLEYYLVSDDENFESEHIWFTIPARPSEVVPVLVERTTNSLEFDPLGTGEQLEFSINETYWSTNGLFPGLESGKQYGINVRVMATFTNFAGLVAHYDYSTLSEQTVPAVDEETIEVTTDSVTFLDEPTWEYRLFESDWQPDNEFHDLMPGCEYVFYIRAAGTEDAAPSEAVEITVWTQLATPAFGEGFYVDYFSESIHVFEGYQIKIGDVDWTGPEDSMAVVPGDIVYVRAYDGHSPPSEAVGNQLSQRPAAPEAPYVVNISKFHMEENGESYDVFAILLSHVPNAEYSYTNGGSWQYDRLVPVLQSGEYTFSVRIAATEESFHGESRSFTVTVEDLPLSPFVIQPESFTATEIVLPFNESWEYSLDAGAWTSNNVFSDLHPSMTYTAYIRFEGEISASASFVCWTAPTTPEGGEGYVLDLNNGKAQAKDGYILSTDGEQWDFYCDVEPEGMLYVSKVYYPRADVQCRGEYVSNILPSRAASPDTSSISVERTDSTITFEGAGNLQFMLDSEDAYWNDRGYFPHLVPETTYTVFVRSLSTEGLFPSEPVVMTTTTKAYSEEPVVESGSWESTHNSITLPYDDSWEYRLYPNGWTRENTFTGLDPEVYYDFNIRVAETDDVMSSRIVWVNACTTAEPPEVGEGYTVYYHSLQMVHELGYELSLDGDEWTSEPLTITPGCTFYVRSLGSTLDSGPTENKLDGRPATPEAPKVIERSDYRIVLNTVDGMEYSIDGVSWSFAGIFGDLTENTTYTIQARLASTDSSFASDSISIEVTTKTHSDIPNVEESQVIVTAETVTLPKKSDWEYSMDGLEWTDSNVFDINPAKEYRFLIRVAETESVAQSLSYTLWVSTPHATPSPGEGYTIEYDNECAWAEFGFEVSKDGETWDTSVNVIPGGLLYVRAVENIFPESAPIENTLPQRPEAPIVTVENATSDEIVLSAVTNGQYFHDNVWTTSRTITGLTPNTEYTIKVRVGHTDSSFAGQEAELNVTTLSSSNVPTSSVIDVTVDSITLWDYPECEYSIDKKNWSESNVFEELTPGTTYTFYVRYAGAEDTYAISATTVNAPPATGEGYTVDYGAGVILAKFGYEISLDGSSWIPSGVEFRVSPGCMLYVRSVLGGAPASEGIEERLGVSARPPSEIQVIEKTDSIIEVDAGDGCEYSRDGRTWMSSGRFTGLVDSTEYTIFVRAAATDDSFPSEAVEVKVRTKSVQEAPAVTFSVTDSSVTLQEGAGFEYSLNGTTWVSSNEFQGLEPSTLYRFYVRLSETNDAMPSDPTMVQVWTAHAAPESGMGYVIHFDVESVSPAEGHEISTDGFDWISEGSLDVGPGGTVYVKVSADDAPESESTVNTLPDRPDAPKIAWYSLGLYEIRFSGSLRIEYQLSTDAGWTTDYSFDGLDDGKSYTFHYRTTASLSQYTSEEASITLTTISESSGIVSGSLTIDEDNNSVTVNVDGIDDSIGITLDNYNGKDVLITSDSLNTFSNAPSVTITGTDGSSVTYSEAVIGNLDDGTQDLSFSVTPLSSDTPGIELTIAGSDGEVHNLGGEATASFGYDLRPGESADDMYVYCVNDDGTREILDAEYANGTVTFTTTHHSRFLLGFEQSGVDPEPEPEPTPEPGPSPGGNPSPGTDPEPEGDVEIVDNPDGSITTTTTRPDGSTTSVTVRPDGSSTSVEESPVEGGTQIVVTETDAEGGSSTTVTTETEVETSSGGVVSTTKVETTDSDGGTSGRTESTYTSADGSTVAQVTVVTDESGTTSAVASTTVTVPNAGWGIVLDSGPVSDALAHISEISSDADESEKLITIRASEDTGQGIQVTIGSDTMGTIADSGAVLEIEGDVGRISAPAEVTENLSSRNSAVSLEINVADVGQMGEAQREAVGDRQTYQLIATSGGVEIHDLGGMLTVTLPYAPAEDEDIQKITVFYVDDGGALYAQPTSYEGGFVTFETTHFSYYMVQPGVSLGTGDGDDGNMLWVGAIVAILTVVALACLAFRRRSVKG